MPERLPDLVAKVSFPLYASCSYSSRHVVVAGGGGASKTGVFNGFAIYEVDSQDGIAWEAKEAARRDTGSQSVMNCALYDDGKRTFLAVGQDADTQVYQVELVRGEEGVQFGVKPMHRVQTDFAAKDGCQNVIRIRKGMAATGGADGCVRLWTFPQMKGLGRIKAHDKEVSDLDISPDGTKIATVAKTSECCVWDKAGEKLQTLKWTPHESVEFLFKRCRFGPSTDRSSTDPNLFTIANSTTKGQVRSYLQLWQGSEFALKAAMSMPDFSSTLAVSRDGKFVAVGSMTSGSIDIHVGFSLQRLKHVEAVHKTFVTSLEFLPPPGNPDASDDEVSLLSMSVDNHLYLHHIEKPLSLPAWVVVVVILVVLVSTFMLCSYLGL